MSAPESGSIAILASPLQVVTFIVTVGVGVTDSGDVLESWMNGKSLCGCELSVRVCGVVAVLYCIAVVGFCRQTLLKWPILPQLRQVSLYAGQFFLLPMWGG